MYIDLINQLAITATMFFIGGKYFEKRGLDINPTIISKINAGIGAGILGTLLMLSTIHVTDTVIVDLRYLGMVIVAVAGGPISAIVSGVFIGLARILISDVSIASLTALTVAITHGIVFGCISRLNISRFRKYVYMYSFQIIVTSIILYNLIDNVTVSKFVISSYVPNAIFASFFSVYIAEYIFKSNKNNRAIMYYKIMADNSVDLLTTHHIDGTFKYISPSSEKILGYNPEELVGKDPYNFYHPDDIAIVRESHFEIMRTSVSNTVIYRFLKNDGSYIWLETTSRLMKSSLNNPYEIISSSRDITARKEYENDLLLSNCNLKELSNLDGLTQISNRRHFDEILEKEWKLSLRNNIPISLIMFDIDQFKKYNDTFGHQQGDICIIEVARVAKTLLKRPNDFIARYGGEEFAVILPDTDKEGARKIAEKIRAMIEKTSIPLQNTKSDSFVTVSLGVATIVPSNAVHFTQLIDYSDTALYYAKNSGRNTLISIE
ncbi:MAG: diguanylate cyclase [Bacillales bacterium]|nr:diguanylate cyclase [Bacillales bacterium]